MLIRFAVGNYRSFREPQTLSLTASGAIKRLRTENTFAPDTSERGLPNLLRCAAVFGPNAAGKSNLVRAIQFVEQLVLNSVHAKPDDPIRVEPFRLDPSSSTEDCSFEIEFIEQRTRYQFGFTVNTSRVTSEWLIAYPHSRPQELYRRAYDAEAEHDIYIYGKQLEGGRLRRDWANQTGAKTLYLSRAVQASSDEFKQLRVPYQWFSKRLRFLAPNELLDQVHSYTSKKCTDESEKKKVIEFMRNFDIPIVDIKINERNIDFSDISDMFSESFLEKIKKRKFGQTMEPVFSHSSSDGSLVPFSPEDESDGTMNLFRFAAKWIDVIENDYVLVVDELDSSLHPLVVWELIRRLSETSSRAQLIFTTHDVTVLRSKLLRRDQIFFVAPLKDRSSKLYSLFDFKGREEDAIDDRYLQGRYGATPVLGR